MQTRSAQAKLTFKVDLPGGENRLREMALYVCEKCASAERFGKVKLNKILWRADFTAFAERSVPVTGRSYQRLAAGPAPVEMPPLLAVMEGEGLIEIEQRDLAGGYVEYRINALQPANLRNFSADDISFVDGAIKYYWSKSATAASELSHSVAWKTRAFLDPLPYESVFLDDRKPTSAQRERLREIAVALRLTTE